MRGRNEVQTEGEKSRLGESPRGLEAGRTGCSGWYKGLNSWMRWAMQVLGGHHSS